MLNDSNTSEEEKEIIREKIEELNTKIEKERKT